MYLLPFLVSSKGPMMSIPTWLQIAFGTGMDCKGGEESTFFALHWTQVAHDLMYFSMSLV